MEKSAAQDFRILFFSGTGNTEWVVRKIRDGLNERGVACESLAADTLQAECGRTIGRKPDESALRERLAGFLNDSSILVIAFPTYASDIPLPLRELLPLLPEGKGRKMASISTILMAGGDACLLPGQILEKRGYRPFLATYVKMPNNIKVPNFDFFELKNGEDLNHFHESAGKAVAEIVEELITQKAHQEGRSIGDYLLGASQRLGESLFEEMWIKNFFATAKCTKCTLCASTCPMGNISFAKGYPEFGRDCCVCLRCYSFCPVSAIQITARTIDEKKYVRYRGFDGYRPARLRVIEAPVAGHHERCSQADLPE